jgi:hypothetical protein
MDKTVGFAGVSRVSSPSRNGGLDDGFGLFLERFEEENKLQNSCGCSFSNRVHEIIGRIPCGQMETNL